MEAHHDWRQALMQSKDRYANGNIAEVLLLRMC